LWGLFRRIDGLTARKIGVADSDYERTSCRSDRDDRPGSATHHHNDEQLRSYADALFKLTALEETTPEQDEAIELLTLLITSYEEQHYPIPKAKPVDLVRFLMDQQGLKNKDLVPQFGTDSAVSMFLSGQRRLTFHKSRR
jgi:HTH-type transcriptional regulator / antitoxin HigA